MQEDELATANKEGQNRARLVCRSSMCMEEQKVLLFLVFTSPLRQPRQILTEAFSAAKVRERLIAIPCSSWILFNIQPHHLEPVNDLGI